MYIFEINPLSVASFAIIFSQSEGCLFTLLIVSFVVQKLLSFVRSHLFVFALRNTDFKNTLKYKQIKLNKLKTQKLRTGKASANDVQVGSIKKKNVWVSAK